MTNNERIKPLAYSYVRFSTVHQACGDSLRRQTELTEKYCQEHGLILANPSAYRDLGVSAFRGKNISTGKLAEFIAAVKSGLISSGSYLIIEHFDRLSRAEVSIALGILVELVDAGISVVTLIDGKVWNRESVADTESLRTALSYMASAHDESRRISHRILSAWGQKIKCAADGTATRILTSEVPRWLVANEDRTGFEILPDIAQSVQRVFGMRINGAGYGAISRRANEERWPLPGNPPMQQDGESDENFAERLLDGGQWHLSLIRRILTNRAVLGEYQPHNFNHKTGHREPVGEPISSYYPAIIDESTFLAAQSTATLRGKRPGRRDLEGRNWLYGLAKCECGQSLSRKKKKPSKSQTTHYARHYCTGRIRGESKCESVNSTQLETLVGYAAASWLPHSWPGETKRETDGVEAGQERLRQVLHEIERIASGHADQDSALRLREELARIFQKIVVHQADGYIEFFVDGRAEPFWLPLDFCGLESACEPTQAQWDTLSTT